MRTLLATLYQNNGTGIPGNSIAVSGQVEDLGVFTQQVDGKMNLTTVKPGELTLKVLDPTGAIWVFIQTQLAISTGTLPPWLLLYVNGVRMFLGNVDLSRCKQRKAASDYSVELFAVDWSTNLSSSYLGSPTALPWSPLTAYRIGASVLSGGSVYQMVPPALWQKSAPYALGATVPAVAASGAPNPVYQVTGPGTSASSGSGPAGTGSAITDGSVTWKYVANPASAASGGPSGAVPVVDGAITWNYVVPLWQRPIPVAANNSATPVTGILGVSNPYLNQIVAPGVNDVCFADPASWVFQTANLQLIDRVILDINGDGSSFYGKPNYVFPAGLQAFDFATGNTYQVSLDGSQWVHVYDSSAQPAYFQVAQVQDNQFSVVQGVSQTPYMVATLTTSPWPALNLSQSAIQNDIFWSFMVRFHADFSLVNPNSQNLSYWTTTVAIPSSPATPCMALSLNSVNGAVVGDQVGVANSPNGATWTVAGVDPTQYQLATLEDITNVPTGTEIYWTPQSQNEFVMVDPRWVITKAVYPYSADFSKFTAPATTDPMFGWVPLQQVGSAGLFAIGDLEPTLTKIKLSSGCIAVNPNTGIPMADYTFTGDPTNGWTGPVTTSPYAPMADWTTQLVNAPGSLMPDQTAAFQGQSTGGAASFSSSQMTLTTVPTFGSLEVQQQVTAAGVAAGTVITGLVSGTLNALGSVYSLSTTPGTIATEAIATAAPAALNPFQRLRNRAYGDAYRRPNNGIIQVQIAGVNYFVFGAAVTTNVNLTGVISYSYTQGGTTYTSATANFYFWSPVGANVAGPLVVYDYTVMKQYVFNYGLNSAGVGTAGQVQVTPWTGTGWGTPTTSWSWPTATNYLQSAVPFIGQTGWILGYGVAANVTATVNNSPWAAATPQFDTLELVNAAGALQASLSLAGYPTLIGGTLITTPYGVYLVSGSSLAQVTYSGGVLSLAILYLVDLVSVLFANTLVARTATELVIFGRLDTGGTNNTTETWLFRIQTPFSTVLDTAVLWSEKVTEGSPTLIGAMRDPTKAGRIVGHLGGSLWQVDSVRPWCIDRFTPGGMTAMECIEHVCQLFNALAIPDPNGVLHIVSRVQSDAATPLLVNQVTVDATAVWPYFSSIVRITSQDSKYYYDAYGQQGGALLEVDNHPMCWSLSGCAAMAESFAVWFGVVRTMSEEEWFFTDPNSAPPWEGLQMFSKITVNGGPAVRLMFITNDIVHGTAKVKTFTA